jgi:hypothetical protein
MEKFISPYGFTRDGQRYEIGGVRPPEFVETFEKALEKKID